MLVNNNFLITNIQIAFALKCGPLKGSKSLLIFKGVPATIDLLNSVHHVARVSHGLIHITDWLPTFFALAGGNPNHVVEGEGFNVWDIIDNETPSQRSV